MCFSPAQVRTGVVQGVNMTREMFLTSVLPIGARGVRLRAAKHGGLSLCGTCLNRRPLQRHALVRQRLLHLPLRLFHPDAQSAHARGRLRLLVRLGAAQPFQTPLSPLHAAHADAAGLR